MFANYNRLWIALGTLAVVALGTSTAEACWGFRCCKARTPVRLYRLTDDTAYLGPVPKDQFCEFGYYPVMCNDVGRWEVTEQMKKEACVVEELIGEKCGVHRERRVQTEKVSQWDGYRFPSWYDRDNKQWHRSRVKDPVHGYVPPNYLPEIELP
jgi:hypothetical protein